MKSSSTLPVLFVLVLTSLSNKLIAQANTQLSNLVANTAVNQHLLPGADNNRNLGSVGKSWKGIFLDGNLYLDGVSFLSNTNIAGCVFLGNDAGNSNTGTNNTGIGNLSLYNNTAGTDNTAVGIQSLYLNTTGSYNTASGRFAMYSNTSGFYNTAMGTNAMYSNISGSSNTAFGYQSLHNNTNGSTNTAVGLQSLFSNTTASDNVSVGHKTMFSNTTGNLNTATGAESLFSNTTGANNTAYGYKSLYSNSTATNNTAIGTEALYANTTGFNNTGTGYNALYNNSIGFSNTAHGAYALINTTSGYQNTSNGCQSMYANTTGISNQAFGFKALEWNTTGNGNTAIGLGALDSNTTGHSNSALGNAALATNYTGMGNTGLGVLADVTVNNLFNATSIGWLTKVDANDKIRLGNSSVTSIGGQTNWTAFSDERIKQDIKENVPGLPFINALRPVTYHFNIAKENKLIGVADTIQWESKYAIEKIQFTGFLAQEVEAAAQELGYDFSGVDKSGEIMGLRYAEFVVPLVKSVQELSAMNEEKTAQIAALTEQNELIIERLNQLEAILSSSSLSTNQTSTAGSASRILLLGQNTPNPFNGITTIQYSISQDVRYAEIKITNAAGIVMQTFELKPGNGSIQVNAEKLPAGKYWYSLFADGVMYDSKSMVVGL